MGKATRNNEQTGQRGLRAIQQALAGMWQALGSFAAAKEKGDYDLVAASGLFDPDYYRSENSDLANCRRDLLQHYLQKGWFEQRNPSSQFDTYWYLDQYSDVRNARINPLVHYVRWGQFEGRLPKRPSSPTRAYDVLGPYESWLAVNALSDRDISEIRQKLEDRSGRLPTIAVITPVYNTDPRLLEEMIESVANQIYERWELCLVDDASPSPHVGTLLDRSAEADSRIRVKRLASNRGISDATNAGVRMATGDVLVFLDHDDLLTPDCLAELAIYYADHPDADIVYSDDDKIDSNGARYAPQFKPNWSPTLLLSWMYLSHAFSVRREVFQKLGGFRSEFDGSQDYEFALRAAEIARHVGHIPKVLYHWRAVEGSTATGGEAKPESMRRGLLAVHQTLERRGIQNALAVHQEWAAAASAGIFDIIFPDDGPSVTIVIAAVNSVDRLRNCLESLRKTAYRNYEVLILDSNSEDTGIPGLVKTITGRGRVRVIPTVPHLSPTKARNEGALHCSSDYLLFLDDCIEVTNPKWMSQMVGYAALQGVGVVGAQLHATDGTLCHAGMVQGYYEGLVGAAFRGLRPTERGYLGLVRTSRECSAVSGACLLTSRMLFEELGRFDEKGFPGTYHDVDFCSRVVKAGRTCVYCASADLQFNAAKDDGSKKDPEAFANFRRLYGCLQDPWYNPNLSLENERFEIEAVRPETASENPLRLVAVTHNLKNQGAPTTLFDLLVGLAERDLVAPLVLSPSDGPLRSEYEEHGIRVVVLDELMRGVFDRETQSVAFNGIGMLLKALGAEVVLANTLQTYWAVKGATLVGLPSIWAQHESEPWDSYFDYLAADLRAAAYEAFSDAYRVIYVADATRRAWRPLEKRRNFKIIRHGIPPKRLAAETSRWTRSAARKKLDLPADAHVVSVVGTVCRRKGQLDLVEAYAKLPRSFRRNTYAFVAGEVAESDYADELKAVIDDATSNVILTGRVADPFLYYAASDILICTSRLESAPRVIIEAMACGLPIVTTPVFGIPELVREDFNALYYEPGDAAGLANVILKLLVDAGLRRELATNSPNVLKGHPGFGNMIEQYGRMIRQAVNLKINA